MDRKSVHLLGDSLIGYGNWHKLLPDYKIISEGAPGESADELLQRLPGNTHVKQPDIFVIMTGTNNLLLYGETSFTNIIEKIILNLSDEFPATKRILTSLLPFDIAGVRESVTTINNELKTITNRTNTIYFDLFTHFEQSDDNLFEYDGVHLNEKGYLLWAKLLVKVLP